MSSNNRKLKIGFFPGVWDCIHPGHILAFKEAKGYCDYLIVGVNEDPSIDNLNKNKPIMSLEEREIVLEGIKYIDFLYFYKTEKELYEFDRRWGEKELFEVIRFMGEDHKGKKHHPIKAKIVYISRKHDYSSTDFRKRIQNAKIS